MVNVWKVVMLGKLMLRNNMKANSMLKWCLMKPLLDVIVEKIDTGELISIVLKILKKQQNHLKVKPLKQRFPKA